MPSSTKSRECRRASTRGPKRSLAISTIAGSADAARYTLPLAYEASGDTFALDVHGCLRPDPIGRALIAIANPVLARTPANSRAGALVGHLLNDSVPRGVSLRRPGDSPAGRAPVTKRGSVATRARLEPVRMRWGRGGRRRGCLWTLPRCRRLLPLPTVRGRRSSVLGTVCVRRFHRSASVGLSVLFDSTSPLAATVQ